MGNSCLTDPNGVIAMKVMDFYDLIDVVSKKSAQETVKILAASSFYVEGVALGGAETPALCRDAKSDESRSQNLENQTAPSTDMLEGESDMSKRIRQRATIGGMAVEDGFMRNNPTESKRLTMTDKASRREALKDEEVRSILEHLLELKEQSA